MTKKTEPTESYLKNLQLDLSMAEERFKTARRVLYNVTATAKLGDPVFETARKACLESVRDIEKIENEISRVRRALGI